MKQNPLKNTNQKAGGDAVTRTRNAPRRLCCQKFAQGVKQQEGVVTLEIKAERRTSSGEPKP